MTSSELRIKVLLCLQSALLGEITPNIRGITCGWNNSSITIHCYFQDEISEQEAESMECIATEVKTMKCDFRADCCCSVDNI